MRDTSRLDLLDFGLKSHNLAMRSHSVPGSISAVSATNCFSAFLWTTKKRKKIVFLLYRFNVESCSIDLHYLQMNLTKLCFNVSEKYSGWNHIIYENKSSRLFLFLYKLIHYMKLYGYLRNETQEIAKFYKISRLRTAGQIKENFLCMENMKIEHAIPFYIIASNTVWTENLHPGRVHKIIYIQIINY